MEERAREPTAENWGGHYEEYATYMTVPKPSNYPNEVMERGGVVIGAEAMKLLLGEIDRSCFSDDLLTDACQRWHYVGRRCHYKLVLLKQCVSPDHVPYLGGQGEEGSAVVMKSRRAHGFIDGATRRR